MGFYLAGGPELDGYGEDDLRHCTVGYTTYWNGNPAFVTAAHCSRHFASTEHTDYFQPTPDPYSGPTADLWGQEEYDPDSFTCNWTWLCRMTDANLVMTTNPSLSIGWGEIARPVTFGSTVIDPDNPFFTITDWHDPAKHEPVHMVGQNSGWTMGTVTETCQTNETVDLKGNRVRINCADHATYGHGNGDSGAPVFYLWGQSTGSVWITGIHHGNHSLTGAALFSRVSRVKEELGGAPTHPVEGTPPPPEECSDSVGPDGRITPC